MMCVGAYSCNAFATLLFLAFACQQLDAFQQQLLVPFHGRLRSQSSLELSMKKLDKGFNLLEQTVIPQGPIVSTVKGGWRLIWQRMMAELAPQDKGGAYQRPGYTSSTSVSQSFDPKSLHVYLGEACPWCHRVKLTIKVKKLDSSISITQLDDDPTKASRGGWITTPASPDPLFSAPDLRIVYDKLSSTGSYQGRCTAPLLVDRKNCNQVSNESSDICRIINNIDAGGDDAASAAKRLDLYPDNLQEQIETTNAWVYELLNNGVYQCGFSTTQKAYDEASARVRQGLLKANTILKESKYLCGSTFTESDIRLLPTMLRYDGVYAPLFKAGGSHLRIKDYPHLHKWLQRCWNEVDGVRDSIDLQKANAAYYATLFPLNPSGIVPTAVTAEDLGLYY